MSLPNTYSKHPATLVQDKEPEADEGLADSLFTAGVGVGAGGFEEAPRIRSLVDTNRRLKVGLVLILNRF